MSLSAQLRAALLAGFAAAACAGAARGQGAVLDAGGAPLAVGRVRGLLVFQERGRLGLSVNRPNRQDLLVELELAAPAPAGARWILAGPGGDASARGAPRAPLDEVHGYWTSRSGARRPPWPGEPEARLEFARLDPGELPPALRELLPAGWSVFAAPVPELARRLGPAQLTSESLVAVYPGALGAASSRDGDGARETWSLPDTELMVLHSHFINVSDNSAGLQPVLGLRQVYRDEGTLAAGHPLWDVPPGRPADGRPGAAGLEATAGLIPLLGADDSLWLTVVEGRPRAARRAALDARVLSHYPSAVDPIPAGRAFVFLGVTVLGVLILATVLLRRRRFDT